MVVCIQSLLSLLSHYRRHPLQGLFLLFGVMLGVALYVAVLAINAQARASYDQSAGLLSARATHEVRAPAGNLDLARYVALRNQGLTGLIPVFRQWLMLAGGERIQVHGLDPVAFLPSGESSASSPFQQLDADFMLPPWQTLVDPVEAQRLGWREGEVLQTAEGLELPPLVFSASIGPGLWLDLGAVIALFGPQVQLSHLQWQPDAALLARWAQSDTADLQLQQVPDPLALRTLTDSFHQNLNALGLLAFAIGLFVCVNAQQFSLLQRRRLCVQLMQLGIPRRSVTVSLMLESLMVVVLAGLLGVWLGRLLADELMPLMAQTLGGLYRVEMPGSLQWQSHWWLQVAGLLLLAWLVVAAPQWWALFRANDRAPMVLLAARSGHLSAQRRDLLLAVTALACLVAAVFGFLWLDAATRGSVPPWAVTAAFGVTGLWLLGAALLLPMLLRLLLQGLRKLLPQQRVLLHWSLADAGFQASRCNLAMMAFLLALAANIGMVTMVGSFREALNEWLDQRIASDLVMRPDHDAEMLRAALQQAPEVSHVHWRRDIRLRDGARELEVLGMPADLQTRRMMVLAEASSDFWAQWEQGGVASISQQMARFTGLAPGDVYTLQTPAGPRQVPIAGIHYDYGNTDWQLLVEEGQLLEWFPQAPLTGIGVHCQPACSTVFVESLRRDLALGEFSLLQREALLALSNRIFNRTFAVTEALQWLTLAVSVLAIFLALLAIESERACQLGSLRAFGVSRWQVGGMALLQTGFLAVVTAALALPFGFGLAYLLINQVNELSFGWSMPLQIQPALWLKALLAGLAAMVLAVCLPAWRLARVSPASLLQRRTQHV